MAFEINILGPRADRVQIIPRASGKKITRFADRFLYSRSRMVTRQQRTMLGLSIPRVAFRVSTTRVASRTMR